MSPTKPNDIQIILFDLDDTLIDTHSVFVSHIAKFFQLVTPTIPHVKPEKLRGRFEEINVETYQTLGVHPNKWLYIAEKLKKEYPSSAWDNALPIIMEIYKKAPKLHRGALQTLRLLQISGLRLGLVTHAQKDWTDIKIDAHRLRPFFEDIVHIDTKHHKDSAQWLRAIKHFNIKPKNVAVVGDNISGDIIAPHQVGVEHKFWVNREDNWSVYHQGELPPGTIEVKELSELTRYLIKNKRRGWDGVGTYFTMNLCEWGNIRSG